MVSLNERTDGFFFSVVRKKERSSNVLSLKGKKRGIIIRMSIKSTISMCVCAQYFPLGSCLVSIFFYISRR